MFFIHWPVRAHCCYAPTPAAAAISWSEKQTRLVVSLPEAGRDSSADIRMQALRAQLVDESAWLQDVPRNRMQMPPMTQEDVAAVVATPKRIC